MFIVTVWRLLLGSGRMRQIWWVAVPQLLPSPSDQDTTAPSMRHTSPLTASAAVLPVPGKERWPCVHTAHPATSARALIPYGVRSTVYAYYTLLCLLFLQGQSGK